MEEARKKRVARVCAIGGLLLLLLSALTWLLVSVHGRPVARVALGDGRILQIEGVTYGTEHRIGHTSVVFERLGPWLPMKVRSWLEPKHPESKITLDHPALVVWVNALDPVTGSNVDCQMIRTEFVAKNGDLFGADTSSWHGGQNFWRVGHIFYSFPRDERELTWEVTTWRSNRTSRVTFLNPHLTQPAQWSGSPLPQAKAIGDLEIALSGLTTRTNGGKNKYWETPAKHWEPVWEFRQRGQPAVGWAAPEWVAEDPLGNRGQFPGVHQSVLRFYVKVFPEATNTQQGALIAALPGIGLGGLSSNIWCHKAIEFGTNTLVVLGICTPGTYVFSDGEYDPTGPRMGPVHGGAPSGWEGQSRRISPVRVKEWHGHYTPSPTIYIRAAGPWDLERLAVRLRDDHGGYWLTKPESQGAPEGIRAFMIELPATVTNVVPELVVLKPVEAEFLVQTGAPVN